MTKTNPNDAKDIMPHPDDVYNPELPNFGNRQYGMEKTKIFWDGSTDSFVDIRLFYLHRTVGEWS